MSILSNTNEYSIEYSIEYEYSNEYSIEDELYLSNAEYGSAY
jgi:hypothetical protein